MNINEELEKNKPIVTETIWRTFPSLINDEDIFQIGLIALWEALKSYEESKASFRTHASRIIERKIIDEIKHRNRAKRKEGDTTICISIQSAINEAKDLTVEEAIVGEKDVESFRDVRDYIVNLPKTDQKIVYGKLNGLTNEEIAEELNIHRTSVGSRIKKIKNSMMKKCL